MRAFRMNTVQQADVDEIRANLRDRAFNSAFKRSVMLLNTIVNSDGPPQRGVRAGAMAMANPPLLREEEKTSLDESIDKLSEECGSLSGNVSTLKAERTQTAASRFTAAPQKDAGKTQQGGKDAGKTATGSTPDNKGGPKNEGQMTTTEGDAKTPDARRTQQNASNAPTAKQPVASQEELESGEDRELMASELSDEPGSAAISIDDVIAIVTVIANLWNRFRNRQSSR